MQVTISFTPAGSSDSSMETDNVILVSAKAANLYTIALKQDLPLDQAQADIVIDELNDIIQIIETYDID